VFITIASKLPLVRGAAAARRFQDIYFNGPQELVQSIMQLFEYMGYKRASIVIAQVISAATIEDLSPPVINVIKLLIQESERVYAINFCLNGQILRDRPREVLVGSQCFERVDEIDI